MTNKKKSTCVTINYYSTFSSSYFKGSDKLSDNVDWNLIITNDLYWNLIIIDDLVYRGTYIIKITIMEKGGGAEDNFDRIVIKCQGPYFSVIIRSDVSLPVASSIVVTLSLILREEVVTLPPPPLDKIVIDASCVISIKINVINKLGTSIFLL